MKIKNLKFKISNIKRYIKQIIVVIIALAIFLGPIQRLFNSNVRAAWYNDNWLYRQAITVTVSSSSSDITNLETLITVDTTGITAKVNTNCEDLRFTNQTGDLLPYYAPSCSDNSATNKVWVLADLVPKNTTTYTMYMYYGNPSASAASDSNKFRLFNSLVGYWTLNESSGNRSDSSVNSNTLTDNNTVTSTTGQYSNAGQFTAATHESLSIADNASLSMGAGVRMNITGWFYFDTTNNDIYDLVMKNQYGGSPTYDYGLAYRGSTGSPANVLEFFVTSDGTLGTYNFVRATTFGTLTAGNWYFVEAGYDGTNIYISVNGGARDTASFSADIYDGAATFYLGDRQNIVGEAQRWMNGRMDDVRLYKRSLSASEVSQLYSNPGTIASTANATVKPSTSFATEEKAPGPAAYWAFDEGTGTNAQDSTTNNNDGTLTNGPTWQTEDQCISGKCLSFDGSTSYIDAGDPSNGSLDFGTGDFSASVWVNPTANGKVVFSKGANAGNAAGSKSGYMIYIDTDYTVWGEIASIDDNTLYYYFKTTNAISASTWTHITMVRTSSSVKVYFNGVLQAGSNNGTGTAAQITTVSTNASFRIGSYTPLGYYYAGKIDEVKVYPYARTAAQVLADYNSRGSVKGSSTVIASEAKQSLSNGLVGYWKMDEASGNRTDSSGNGNTLTDTNTVASTTGKFGNAGQFENSPVANNEYLSITDNASVSTGDVDWTISGWIYMDSKPGANMSIISKDDWVTSKREFNFYWNQATDRFEWWLGNGVSTIQGTATASSLGAPSLSTWYYVVFWHDSVNDTINIQVNDGTVDSTATSGAGGDSAAPFVIGGFNTTGQWDGRIDEVRFYKKVLTSAERTTLYNFAPGPVGYWNFEEGTGTSANDTSGSGYTGTLTNGPTWTSGKYGKAVKFDGSDDQINLSNIAFGSSFTMSAWVKRNAATGTYTIVDFNDNTSVCYLRIGETNANAASFACSTNIVITDTANISDGKWHYVTGVRDSTTAAYLYVDGILVGNDTSYTATTFTSTQSRVGRELWLATNYFPFDGSIDEVKVYNYARTAKQIVSDMNASHPAVGSPVGSAVGYWKFDEGVDNTCSGGTNDTCNSGSGGSSLDGAGSGFSSPATSTSGWTQAGKFGKALIFDGTDDYVNLGNSGSLNPTNDLTISMWFKTSADTSGGAIDHLVDSYNGTTMPYSLHISNNLVTFATYDGTNNPSSSSVSTVNDNSWHHVIGVRNTSTDTLYLYVDGKLIDSDNDTTTGAITAGNNTIYLGARLQGGIQRQYTGSLDEVKIYNYALTASEVAQDMNRGSSQVLGALSDNSTYQVNAANQEYCVPGDTSSCAAPVGRWDFEDTSLGSSVQDTSGNAYTGTWNGTGTHWTSGKYGKAGNFNGTDDYVSITDNLNLGDNDFTVSAWMNTTGGFLMSKRNSDTVIEWNINAATNPIFSIFTSAGGSAGVVTSSESITAGQWYYITAVNDETNNQIKIYINGKLTGTTTKTGSITDSVSPFRIGAIGSTPSNFFTGKVDGVRIYNYARSAAQVAWDYNKGGPVGHWKFDECQGDRANDSSGNGNHGTITIAASGTQTAVGTCTGSANTAWKDGATGKYNSSLDFDGTDDYVNVPHNSTFNWGTNPFSISLWVKTTSSSSTFIMGRNSVSAGWYISYNEVGDGSDFKVRFQLYGELTGANGTTAVNDGNWHHITAVRDSSTVIYLYTDGKLEGTGNANSANVNLSNTALAIGDLRVGGGSYFGGTIDEVKIYNYALTATQIKNVYNEGAVHFGPSTGSP